MISWRTSLIGLILIILGIAGMALAELDKVTGGALIAAGLGFLSAKDAQVHGGTIAQATPPETEALSVKEGKVLEVKTNG